MDLYGNLSDQPAMAGMLYGMNPKTIVSHPAQENINFGKGVFWNKNKNGLLNGKHSNVALIDLSAYSTASKDIVLTINGVNITKTTTGTIADDVAAILADINDDVDGVTATSSANKITVKSDDESELTVKLMYDGSDVTDSKVTKSSEATYAGVSVFHQNAFLDSRGYYVPKEAVNVMEKGYIYGVVASGVTPTIEATAYVTKEGTFTTSSSGNTEVGKFKSEKVSGADGYIALIVLE